MKKQRKNKPAESLTPSRGATYQKSPQIQRQSLPPLTVRVVNGHLKYANYPIIIGHFKEDGIVSAEKVMDQLLDGKLSERLALGLYPGAIGTSLVVLPDLDHELGTVIVGLGDPENLTPFLLSKTIEAGCLDYVLKQRDATPGATPKHKGIAALLVGSAYGFLSLGNSINAILDGVVNANRQIAKLNNGLSPIVEIELIELYRDKALNAFYFLHEITKGHKLIDVELAPSIREVEGSRNYIPLFDEKEWWKRITALYEVEEVGNTPSLYFSSSTGLAKVEVRKLLTDQNIIDALLKKKNMETRWDREMARAIFELLVPNDFKLSFKNQQNILLILDKFTARYPWELLHPDDEGNPICVSAGLIRQLSSTRQTQESKSVNQDKALIIGDPLLKKSSFQQLPGAMREAEIVGQLLAANNYTAVVQIREPFEEIVPKLFSEHKVIHVASHGVVDYGPGRKSGILLSDDTVLSAAEINQISRSPELVFINSCYLGKIDPEQEEHFHQKYQLAANIGTQLIENGVKAVVVAGWAVHDKAAQLFAEVFYTQMLEGELFAEAVKAARASCYREFPDTTTWGAYQCYGDPFYQLARRRKRQNEQRSYILDKEILIDLEILINDARSSGKRADNLRERLEELSRKIDASQLRNGKITEMEAMAYAEIQEFEIAIAKYESLLSEEKADYSIKALEQWCNLRAQQLTGRKGEWDNATLIAEMSKIIEDLRQLLQFGHTSERHALLGSAYKRLSMLLENEDEKRTALSAMADQYEKALFIANENRTDPRIYPLTNWLAAEILLADPERLKAAREKLGQDLARFLSKQEARIQETAKSRKDFWDLIAMINLNQCKLLLAHSPKDQQEILQVIQTSYRRAWKLGGSKKQKNSELIHMTFLQDTLNGLGKKDTSLYDAIEKLILFFETI